MNGSWRRSVMLELLAVVGTGLVWAQSTGTFTATGNMTVAREQHTATLLPNGKVLIAGGAAVSSGATFSLASAELYDPSMGTFTATGSMTTARQQHAATLLPNGKVLIVGGNQYLYRGSDLVLASAELYDPSTGAFIATGNMTTAQYSPTATLLGNGKVLVAGGQTRPFPGTAGAALYDPATGAFTATGAYADGPDPGAPVASDAQNGAKATLLTDGSVLIVGWLIAELYDPGIGAFSLTGISGNPPSFYLVRYEADQHTATLLMNGEVLVAGGIGNEYGHLPGFETAAVYDPSAGKLILTGNMTVGRAYHTATLLPDGTVLIVGGYLTSPGGFSTAERYDPAKGEFSAAANMNAFRAGHTATLLPDGAVLIAGGVNRSGVTTSAELYNPPLLQAAPILLSLSDDGRGQGAIQHADTYEVASSSNPAVPGEILIVYCTGLVDGSVIPPQIAIGGRMAEVLFFGNTPGFAGLNQVNVRVPTGVTPGPAVPVRLTYLDRPSNEVTIGVE